MNIHSLLPCHCDCNNYIENHQETFVTSVSHVERFGRTESPIGLLCNSQVER